FYELNAHPRIGYRPGYNVRPDASGCQQLAAAPGADEIAGAEDHSRRVVHQLSVFKDRIDAITPKYSIAQLKYYGVRRDERELLDDPFRIRSKLRQADSRWQPAIEEAQR